VSAREADSGRDGFAAAEGGGCVVCEREPLSCKLLSRVRKRLT
jgi:3-oxoacyl-(acyl-carrier-protein) synthase